MSTFRTITAIVLMTIGMIFILISCIGVFRMKFALNRMHSASIADTCGILFCTVGLCVLSGFTFMTLKMLLVLVVFWLTSPISGHLISNLIKTTKEKELKENAFQKELEK
ncbi:MAG: monovalent cation/H(+) antiporter subunit G [Lachnospiraceae bacterium]|jgi:multicomponent Na+:H+ antiporter subunit G|nr:monovalent cation/H(+) antiporter subunit G [Lachnospiraceae bacterium]